MKVLHILAAFPRHENDPIVPWLVRLMDEMETMGIQSDVYTSAYRGGGNREFHGHKIFRFRYATKNLETFTHDERAVDKARKAGLVAKIIPQVYLGAGMAGLVKMRSQMEQDSYDVIHVHWPFPHWIFAEAARHLFDAAIVASFYEAEFSLAARTPGGNAIMRRAIRKAEEIVAISSWTARRVLALEPRRPHVIPFAMGTTPKTLSDNEVAAETAKREKRRTSTVRRQLLFVGNLIERKGVDVLIEAMTLLPENFSLVVTGEGGMKKIWEKQAEPLGTRIRFSGRVSNEELNDLYMESDYFILPAKTDSAGEVEGQGVVLLEAMAVGLPCVASRTGGIVDLVRDGDTGVLAEENSPSSLAQGILALDNDKSLRERCAAGGARMVRDEFSWPHLARKWANVYQRAVTQKKKR